MAEILVKAIDAHHPDPTVDLAGCYKRGDPVVIMPDGHQWGSEEGPPTFYIVKLPGVDPADLQMYNESHMEEEPERLDPEGNPMPRMMRSVIRRKYNLDLNTIELEANNEANLDILPSERGVTLSKVVSEEVSLGRGQLGMESMQAAVKTDALAIVHPFITNKLTQVKEADRIAAETLIPAEQPVG